MNFWKRQGPGLLFAFGLGLIASSLGYFVPMIGGPVFGIVMGILVNNTVGKPEKTKAGLVFTSKKILQWAIIVLGCGLSLGQVWQTGIDSLSVMVFTITAAFLAAFLFGKWLRIPFNLNSLIGVGTAICGGSAIAAVSPIIEAEEMEIAYSISTVFLFNVVAVLLFPALGHGMGLSDHGYGLWAGTAINDTSSVVAAGYAYSDEAGKYATIVKLTRTTLIIPVSFLFVLIVGMKRKREEAGGEEVSYPLRKIFPWFIVWFVAASLLNTLGLFTPQLVHATDLLGKFMITMALTAIGLNADFRKMMKTGFKPMVLGALVWAIVTIVSLLVQSISHQL